ncbi:hypothetical protein A3K24_00650 [candidate division Kazan bacterium RIFCSPHIGHO2_01_FULL_44_14]|uniref:Uncharacterized protein n=1 Tax=candidate division Kazan bacterium RIFCSPLOWO2_01_FULL_45_19 TaxID=1798538 RepID=A0A1F4NPJ3_UNCK3|nr:MAG: hypothetical protein A3K51_00650 [candidate division Kazan bacterium RIFCSPLOWO2_01_FULL_45_19]OGB77619.1 MAG: hypothetical protein A3K24_00650 [candidate division Kazan bacterium RIFCSPHIGHO2_01_FULL_44_14]
MKAFQHRVALTVAWFVALVHLVWILIVAGGMGQQFIDWVCSLHFMANPMTVGVFSWGSAIWLLIVAFIVGYIIGWVFAGVYNWVSKKK